MYISSPNIDIKTTQNTNCERWQCKVVTPGKRTLDLTFTDMWMITLSQHSGIMKPVYIDMVTYQQRWQQFPRYPQSGFYLFHGAGDWTQGLVDVRQGIYCWAISLSPNSLVFSIPLVLNMNARVPESSFISSLFPTRLESSVLGFKGFLYCFHDQLFCCLN